MNKILCLCLVICAIMALSSASPLEPEQKKITLMDLEQPAQVAAEDETLQPEESRYRRHGWGGGWGRRGWGYGGGWGRGGWGRGGYGGGYGRGWGYGGGYGGGYGYGGGWGGGWGYGR